MSSGSFWDGVLGGLGLFLLGAWLLAEGLTLAFGARLRAWWTLRGEDRLCLWLSGAWMSLGSPLSEPSSRALAGLANSGRLGSTAILWIAAGHLMGPAALAWCFVVLAGTAGGDALALALVAGGVAALWSAPEATRGAIGRALCGAGLLLFGVNLIASGFAHTAGALRLDGFPGGLALRAAALAVVGAALTAGLRSASASVVLMLAAARADALSTSSAAFAVLGALAASAWGALLGLESGTRAARRAGLGVIVVHALGALGGLALALGLGPALDAPPAFLADPARTIALILTVAPLLPLLALQRLDRRLTDQIERRLGSDAPDELAALHLDGNLRALPPLAFEAVAEEARRLHSVAGRLAAAVLSREPLTARREAGDRELLRVLATRIEESIALLARTRLDARSAQALPALTRVVSAAWELGEQSAWLHAEGYLRGGPLGDALESRILRVQLELARLLDPAGSGGARESLTPAQAEARLGEIEERLRDLRAAATERCTAGQLAAADLDDSIERLATLRRLAQLAVDSIADLAQADTRPGADWTLETLPDEAGLAPATTAARPLR
jgi:phosphate:Na+ symporter